MRKLKITELGRPSLETYLVAEKHPIRIVLDNVRSLHNIGSVFRTADAFGVEGIDLCGITACPPHRDIQKTALGATESVAWQYFDSPEKAIWPLKEQGYRIIAIEQTEPRNYLQNFKVLDQEKYAFVFGHEVRGASEEVIALADEALEIPQIGTKHSLNVSVSVGIVLWDIFKQLN